MRFTGIHTLRTSKGFKDSKYLVQSDWSLHPRSKMTKARKHNDCQKEDDEIAWFSVPCSKFVHYVYIYTLCISCIYVYYLYISQRRFPTPKPCCSSFPSTSRRASSMGWRWPKLPKCVWWFWQITTFLYSMLLRAVQKNIWKIKLIQIACIFPYDSNFVTIFNFCCLNLT